MSVQWVFGFHAVLSLLKRSPKRILEIYVLQGREDDRMRNLLETAKQSQLVIKYKTRQQLDELQSGESHQGVMACCQPLPVYNEYELADLLEPLDTIRLLILDGVQDPHNLGACLRVADAAGVNAVIVPKDNSAGLTATVKKVACGAAEVVPFVQVTNLARTLKEIKELGVWLWGTADNAEVSLYKAKLQGNVGLVMGSEGTGMRRLTRELCDGLISLPMLGSVESLNVSVATGICLYEMIRQNGGF